MKMPRIFLSNFSIGRILAVSINTFFISYAFVWIASLSNDQRLALFNYAYWLVAMANFVIGMLMSVRYKRIGLHLYECGIGMILMFPLMYLTMKIMGVFN